MRGAGAVVKADLFGAFAIPEIPGRVVPLSGYQVSGYQVVVAFSPFSRRGSKQPG
jgi:hypothetical protein